MERREAEQYDEWVEQRVEFMYNYLDYNNDRYRLREQFANEMHKKTSLQDVGEKLDEFILDSKAKQLEYWNYEKHTLEQPGMAEQNIDASQFNWKNALEDQLDPLKPHWIDDPNMHENLMKEDQKYMKDLIDEVEFKDQMRDHSID